MQSVDTNVLVRAIVRDDPKQAASAEAFITKGSWVSHLVLVETTWVLRTAYDLSAADIANAVEMLIEHESLVIQEPEVVSAALVVFRSRSSLGFSDCLILEIARKAGHLPLATFDRGLAKIDGTFKLESR